MYGGGEIFMVKTFFKSVCFLLISACIGVVSLMAVYSLSTEPMVYHVKDSVQIYDREGLYPSWAPGKKSTQSDNFTDAIMVRNAIYPDNSLLLKNALLNPKFNYPKANQVQSLVNQVNEKPGAVVSTYPRYWHGYLVFLKPALMVLTISNIRMVNMLFQFLLAAWVIYLLYNKLGKGVALSYFLMYLSLNPFSLALSFQFSSMYYVMSFASLFLLLRTKWVLSGYHFCYVCLFAGIFTAFFDLLTYPLISLGVPLVIFLLFSCSGKTKRELFWAIITCTFFWGVGYGGMYMSKWILGNVLTDSDVLANALRQLGHRVSNRASDNAANQSTVSLIETYGKNLKVLKETVLLPVLIFLPYILYKLRTLKKNIPIFSDWIAVRWGLGFIACYPFFWYAVLCNHSYVHFWFTYRELGITVFAIGCLLATLFFDISVRKDHDE